MGELVLTSHRIFFDKEPLALLSTLTQVCKVLTRSGRQEIRLYGTTGDLAPTQGGVSFYVWQDSDLLLEYIT